MLLYLGLAQTKWIWLIAKINKLFSNQAHNVHEQLNSILALSSLQMVLESSDIWETTKSFRKKGLGLIVV